MSAADTIRERHIQIRLLEDENLRLRTENGYLRIAVDLLSLPRTTEDDVRRVRDGLLALEASSGVTH